jgi:hypothetical protein
MHAPSLMQRPVFQRSEQRPHHHSILRKLHAHLRGWARSENLMASFSLALLVTIVLVLVYQAMAI